MEPHPKNNFTKIVELWSSGSPEARNILAKVVWDNYTFQTTALLPGIAFSVLGWHTSYSIGQKKLSSATKCGRSVAVVRKYFAESDVRAKTQGSS